jgi:holo-[acyl-carrier protein] synthase
LKGIGTDIIEVDRIRSNLKRYGSKFLDKILTSKERENAQKYNDAAPHVAGRFAAKEAVAKALGCGFGDRLDFHDIEILNNESGQPIVHLSEKARNTFDHPSFLISISHCKSHAVAMVIKD